MYGGNTRGKFSFFRTNRVLLAIVFRPCSSGMYKYVRFRVKIITGLYARKIISV